MKTKIIITLNLIVATFIFIYVLNYEEENNSLNKTINLIHETSCFKSSDKYYQIYNKENNLYELYDYNQNLINSSNNQITLYQDNIYSLDNKVYLENKELKKQDNFYVYDNKFFYLNSSKLHSSNDNIYVVSDNNKYFIYNKLNNNTLILDNYKLVIFDNKLEFIYSDNSLYDIENFEKIDIIGSLLDDKQQTYCLDNASIIQYNTNKYLFTKNDNKVNILDFKGNLVNTFLYDDIVSTKENYFIVYDNNKYGVVDINKKVILDISYDKIYYNNNYYLTLEDRKINVYDEKFQKLTNDIDINYEDTKCDTNNPFKVNKNGNNLFISYYDKVYLIENNNARLFEKSYIIDDLLIVRENKKLDVYDLTMKKYQNIKFDRSDYDNVTFDVYKNTKSNHLNISIVSEKNNEYISELYVYDLVNEKILDSNTGCFNCNDIFDITYSLGSDFNLIIYNKSNEEIYNMKNVELIEKLNDNMFYVLDLNETYHVFTYQ